jgi:hypothetical protein
LANSSWYLSLKILNTKRRGERGVAQVVEHLMTIFIKYTYKQNSFVIKVTCFTFQLKTAIKRGIAFGLVECSGGRVLA